MIEETPLRDSSWLRSVGLNPFIPSSVNPFLPTLGKEEQLKTLIDTQGDLPRTNVYCFEPTYTAPLFVAYKSDPFSQPSKLEPSKTGFKL